MRRAMAAFQAAADIAPGLFPAYILLGHAATVAEEKLTAGSALRTAQGLQPDAAEPGTFRARLELDQDMVAEAEASASGVLATHRNLPVPGFAVPRHAPSP